MKRILLVAAAIAAAACNLKPQSDKAVREDPPFTVPHEPHADVACTACHGGIEQAKSLEADVRHVQLPARISQAAACKDCHDEDPKVSVPKRSAPFRLSFSHADHLPRVSGKCEACHDKSKLPDKGAQRYAYPSMATCTACHEHQADYNQARCTPCHTDLKGLVPVSTFAHQGNWLKQHGQFAKPVAESCAQCHDQTYCNECHSAQTAPAKPDVIYPEQVERAFIHRGDYVSRHMIEARSAPESCRKCHGSAFCEACHAVNGVSAADAARFPHPPGYRLPGAGPRFHGDDARRDILSCAGCHDQAGTANVCYGCHRPGGSGAIRLRKNIHPPAFLRSHDLARERNNQPCVLCHG